MINEYVLKQHFKIIKKIKNKNTLITNDFLTIIFVNWISIYSFPFLWWFTAHPDYCDNWLLASYMYQTTSLPQREWTWKFPVKTIVIWVIRIIFIQILPQFLLIFFKSFTCTSGGLFIVFYANSGNPVLIRSKDPSVNLF